MKVIGVSKKEALASGIIAEAIGSEPVWFSGIGFNPTRFNGHVYLPKCPKDYTPTNFQII